MARGRRVNSSGEKSKQLLLEKAMELFSSNGYHQTKISDIVKAADLTQPTFYLYFQSKESLFNDLHENFQKNLYAILSNKEAELQRDVISVKEIIHSNLTKIFTYFVKNPNLSKIGFYDSEQATNLKANLVKILVDILNNESNQLIVQKQVDNCTLAQSLMGTIERLTLTNLLTHEREPQQLADDIVNIYFVEERVLVTT
ncbi:helix-turn-helix domain-containing protein [Solibacillus sp. CAU 1738]|uniref:TetR/AcrR family transcriptional regulator n=1 Tax=Solibacillus sp. CAU 1738 TaxID=3140363 RepID=UPI003260CAE0